MLPSLLPTNCLIRKSEPWFPNNSHQCLFWGCSCNILICSQNLYYMYLALKLRISIWSSWNWSSSSETVIAFCLQGPLGLGNGGQPRLLDRTTYRTQIKVMNVGKEDCCPWHERVIGPIVAKVHKHNDKEGWRFEQLLHGREPAWWPICGGRNIVQNVIFFYLK